MRPAVYVSAGLLLVAAACSSGKGSSTSESDKPGPDAGAGDAATGLPTTPPPGGKWTIAEFKTSQSVPADTELFECQVVSLPDVAGWMVQGQHEYTPGSHHLLFYTSDLTPSTVPAGSETAQPCYEGSGSNLMSHITGVLYGGQVPMGSESFPPGIGLPTTASQLLIMQVHYLNATAATLDSNVDVKLTIDSGTDITTNAGVLFFYDPFIDVPMGAMAQAQMRCPITGDITLLSAQSHYHSRGINYGAFVDSSPTTLGTVPFYTSDSWTSPPLATMKMPIPAGSLIRFQCDYDNTIDNDAGTMEYYQGQSAFDNEMCMFIGTYYPDVSSQMDNCVLDPDMFGTGTATCSTTLTCLEACPNPNFGMNSSPCVQKCIADSCPTAFDTFEPLLECIGNKCGSQCGSSAGSACTSCVASSCASQYVACSSATCN